MTTIMKRPLLTLTLVYGGITIVFALIYWTIWNIVPDAFLVNDEFNRYPTSDLYELAALRPAHEKSVLGADDYELSSALTAEIRFEANKLKSEWLKVEKIAKELPLRRKSLEENHAAAVDALEESRSNHVDQYRRSSLNSFQTKEHDLEKALSLAESRLAHESDPDHRLPLINAVSQAKINLLNAKIETARKEVEISDNVVNKYGSFGDPKLFENVNFAYAQLKSIEQEELNKDQRFSDLSKKSLDLLKKQKISIVNRIGFVDFLYFSMGVSTTSTFGDIMPNARVARSLVIIQLISCAAIFSWLLSHLGEIIAPARSQ